MTPEGVMEFGRMAMLMLLKISAPALLAALVVGLAVSLLQAVTQVNESTLAFVPKLVAVLAALALAGPWLLGELVAWLRQVITAIPAAVG